MATTAATSSSTTTTTTTTSTTTTTISDLDRAIVAQVNYYFSPKNLARDEFLQRHIKIHPEGFVPLSVLLTFPKLKALCSGGGGGGGDNTALAQLLASALKHSEQLVVSEDGGSVRAAVDRSAIFDGPVQIGQYIFRNANHMRNFFRDILHRYDYEMKLSEVDQKSVLELLTKYHASAKSKIGSGVSHIKVGTNAQFPGTKCFMLVRADGTTEDFSYLKCVDSAFAGRVSRPNSQKSSQAGGTPSSTTTSADDDTAALVKFSPVVEVEVKPTTSPSPLEVEKEKDTLRAHFSKFGDILNLVEVPKSSATTSDKGQQESNSTKTFQILFRTFQSASAAAVASSSSESGEGGVVVVTAKRIPVSTAVVKASPGVAVGQSSTSSSSSSSSAAAAASEPTAATTKPARTYDHGLVLRADSVPAKLGVHDLKQYFGTFGGVGYVELIEETTAEEPKKETISAYIRFKDAEGVQATMRGGEEVNGVRQHKLPETGTVITLAVISGEEEQKYYQTLWDHLDSAGSKKRKAPYGGGGGGRGRGRGRGRGGKRGRGGRGGRGGRRGGGNSDDDGGSD